MNTTKALRTLLYSGDLLAVDLGTFSVKILSLKAKNRSLTVFDSASREVWAELSDAKSEDEKNEVYARALRELMTVRGFKPRNASIALAGSAVLLKFLPLPAGYSLDPDTDLPAEARALIPFEEADSLVSALVLDGAKGDKKSRAQIMLATAQRKTVQGGMDVVRRAGLRPAVIINDVLALANAYEFFEGKNTNDTLILVSIGATSTSVCVVEGGAPKAARILNIAGNTFTRALKREFAVDFQDAENLKIAHGLAASEGKSPEEDLVAARVARTLRPAVKDLSAEIHRTVDGFLERRSPDYPPIRRIVMSGGSAELKGLPEALAADSGFTVEVFRPMVNVTAKGGGLAIVPLATAFVVPCGLGLSNTLVRRSYLPRINLVPRRVRRAAIIRDISPGFWRLIAGPAFVVTALSFYGVWAVRVSRHDAAMEQTLETAAKKEQDIHGKFTMKKAVVVKRVADPFAFLSRLTITGVFGDGKNTLVMLNGGEASYVARGGRLFGDNEEEVRGVSSEMSDNSVVLIAGGRRYVLELPK